MSMIPQGEDGSMHDSKSPLSNLVAELLAEFDVEIEDCMDETVVKFNHENIVPIAKIIKFDSRLDCDYLRCLSAVDYKDRIEIVYHLSSLEKRHKLILKTYLTPEYPTISSVVSVWPGSNWFEREAHDLFGVTFLGHPNLEPLLLFEGFEGYPGRKNFPFNDYDEW